MSKRQSSLFLILAVLLGLLAPVSVALALDNKSVDAITHAAQCAQWMLTDPAKHAKYCSPGHTVFVSGSTGSSTHRHYFQSSESTSEISDSGSSDSESSGT